jgi:tetratricopeptide (TPR) repeat protein
VADEARLGIAEAVGWAGNHAAAVPLLKGIVDGGASERHRLRAKVSLADCLVTLGELAAGHRLVCEIIEQYPQRPVLGLARIIRADAARQMGRLEEAAADAQAYLSWPAREALWISYAHYILGQQAWGQGRLEEAEGHFTAAAGVGIETPVTAIAWAGMAQCRRAAGDADGALAALLEAADRAAGPSEECLYLYRAVLLAEAMGDQTAASDLLAQMVEEFPGSHLTTRLVGRELLPVPEI